MLQCKAERILLTGYTVLWLSLLSGIWCALSEGVSRRIGEALDDLGGKLPVVTERIAIPLIGGLRHVWPPEYGPTWVTYLVWGLLIAWPIANLVIIWRCRDAERMRRRLVYSYVGYGLLFFAVALVIIVGLCSPFGFL